MTAYLGQISLFAENRIPNGWHMCDGTLLPIAQYTALFSLLGTVYGGDGQTTFGLPDLRGRVPVHQGHGPGLSNYFIGQRGGSDTVSLTSAQVGYHNHTFMGVNDPAVGPPNTGVMAEALVYGPADGTTTALAATSVQSTGSNPAVGHDNVMPVLALNFIICIGGGVYPSRN